MVQKIDQFHDAVFLVRYLQQGELVEHLIDSMNELRFVWTWPESELYCLDNTEHSNWLGLPDFLFVCRLITIGNIGQFVEYNITVRCQCG